MGDADKPRIEVVDATGAKVERQNVSISVWADGRHESTGLLPGDTVRCGDILLHREPAP